MPYTNNHLVEVVCGLQFPSESTPWDSTLFGQFYEKIRTSGFSEKEERKGFQLDVSPEEGPVIEPNIEESVIFKDNSRGWAIMMGKHKVSFHIVRNYSEWARFEEEFILPYFAMYQEIGLGNGPRRANVIYLNRFSLPSQDSLGDYFTIVSSLPDTFGVEVMTGVQRVFHNQTSRLVAKLNCKQDKGKTNQKIVTLECGALCIDQRVCNSATLKEQINITHDPIRSFFEEIITDKLRNNL